MNSGEETAGPPGSRTALEAERDDNTRNNYYRQGGMRDGAVIADGGESKSALENRAERRSDDEHEDVTLPSANIMRGRTEVTGGHAGRPDGADSADAPITDTLRNIHTDEAGSEVVPREEESAPEIQTQQVAPASEVQTQQVASASEIQTKQVASASEVQTQQVASASEVQTQQMASASEVHTQEVASASEVHTQQVASASEVQTQQMASASEVQTQQVASASEVQTQEVASASEVHTQEGASASEAYTQEVESASKGHMREGRSASKGHVGEGVLYCTEGAISLTTDPDEENVRQRAAIDSKYTLCSEDLPLCVDNAPGGATHPSDIEPGNAPPENQPATENDADKSPENYRGTSFPATDKSTKSVSSADQQLPQDASHARDKALSTSRVPSKGTRQPVHTNGRHSMEKNSSANSDLEHNIEENERISEVLTQQETQRIRGATHKTPRTLDETDYESDVAARYVSQADQPAVAAEWQLASKIAMDTLVATLSTFSAPPAAIWQSLTLRGKLQHRNNEVNNHNNKIKSLLKVAEGKIVALETQLDEERRELTAQIDDLTERVSKTEELNALLSEESNALTERSNARERNLELDFARLQKERDAANANWEQEHLARSEGDAHLRVAEQQVAKMRDMLETSLKKASEKNVDALMRQFVTDLRREKAQKGTQTLTDPLVFLRDYNLGSVQELLSVACDKAGLYVSFQALKYLDLCTVARLLQKNNHKVRDGAFQRANEALQEVLQRANALDHKRHCFNRRNFIISPRYDAKLWSRQSLLLRPVVPVEPLPKLVDSRTNSMSVRD